MFCCSNHEMLIVLIWLRVTFVPVTAQATWEEEKCLQATSSTWPGYDELLSACTRVCCSLFTPYSSMLMVDCLRSLNGTIYDSLQRMQTQLHG